MKNLVCNWLSVSKQAEINQNFKLTFIDKT